MPKVNTFNYDTIASWNGAQDLFVVEQPDGTKVATPAMVKQFIEAGNFEATGEVKDGHGNILNNMANSADFIGQKNVWFPDLYDFNTKIKTLTAQDCITYTQKIGDMTIAYVYTLAASQWGSFSTMAQLRNFPNGTNNCCGGCVYNGDNRPLMIQASNIGVYFRPNVTGTFGNTLTMVLFFAKL